MADRVGQQFGNYRLERLLGQGGFAEVYLGEHLRLNLQAAIKVLHAHLTGQEAEHFQQEAQTIATLMHPAIVRILDYDVQEGVPFLVMDYAPGGSLRQRYPKGTPVPVPHIVSYVKQVAAALQYAHERKFIHRDVKPENMLVGRQEELLLSDFGLAALAHGSGSLSTKEAIGTLSYMAPEQIEGHPRAASDQYALGCVVYEWLCGSRPFDGSPTEVMVQHLSMPPQALRERLPAIPAPVEQVVLRALAKDPKARFTSVAAFAAALEEASQHAASPAALVSAEQPAPGAPAAALATVAVQDEAPAALVATPVSSEMPADLHTPAELAGNPALTATTPAAPFLATTPAPAQVPALPVPAQPRRRRTLAGLPAALLIGLAVLVVAGGVLGSLSLLTHFGVLGARSAATMPGAVRGGTWVVYEGVDPSTLIPNLETVGPGSTDPGAIEMRQPLYLPLFYGDAQGVIHPGAARERPTVQNGDISADGTTWTFHLRAGLLWSDGQPYDARDVDFTWKLWLNPKFPAVSTAGFNLISSASVSADHLSITFHLKHAYAPFLSLWVDGALAPLPAHHFSAMAPDQILKSSDNLNPQVTSGPFMMAESVPGDHYTMVRNPRYYLAREGLPYLDKVVFNVGGDFDSLQKELQAGTVDSIPFFSDQHLAHYTLVTPPTSATFEALYFNFHNVVLASHREVRQAMALAIDQQSLIQMAGPNFAQPLCTDHPSALHPGYEPGDYICPEFSAAVANKLLDDNGWVKGSDGVRSKNGQRLEFELSTTANLDWRSEDEMIVQHNLMAIGIKLDIQNYPRNTFFGPFLQAGKASPPTGAVAGRYDIAEYANSYGYDPDDSGLFSCDQFPPQGSNLSFYCNHALDALFQQELATADPDVRQQIFEQIHRIYLTEFPFITLFSYTATSIVRKGTHNFQVSPIEGDTINIAEWWCDKGKC